MNERSVAIKVGIFLTIIVAVFIVGQLWLLRFNVGREGYLLEILFDDVSGLKYSDPVRVFGIDKGKVVKMDMQAQGVIVTTWIERNINLSSDATASIQDIAMISGTKTIVLNPGVSGEPFDLSKPIIGRPNLGLSTVEVGAVVGKVETLVEIFKKGLDEGSGTLRSLESTLNNLDVILRENRKGIKDILDKGGTDLDDAKDLMEELSLTSSEIRNIIHQINSEKGTMGKMIYDEDLYDNLVRASANLDSLLIDIRKNPGRYVHISVF